MSASAISPLPSVYQVQYLGEVDSVCEEAVRQARAGAGEGTLIVAGTETMARTRRGKPWHSDSGNLHCAVILEPEYSNRTAQQLMYVAVVAAGTAVAEVVAPMTGVSVGWPGNLYVNNLLTGQVSIASAGSQDDPWAWLVVCLRVNVTSHPVNPEPECYNCIQSSGDALEVRAEELLGFYARHFLRWINRWADEGFEPVRKAWLQRVEGLETWRRFQLDDGPLEGVVQSLGKDGELLIREASGEIRKLTLKQYFSL